MSKRNPIERSQYINNQYKEYLRSSFEFKTPKLQKLFEQQLEVEDLFKGPYVDLNLPCQLCNKPAPFYNKKGEPYLECHHIVWIARGGADEVYNAVALCPNCHRKMHSLDEPADVAYLKKVAKK